MPSTSTAEASGVTTPQKVRAAHESSPCLSPSVSANWSADFAVPWNKMSHTMMGILKSGKRPTPKDRRGLVRTITDAVHHECPRPQLRQLSRIAETVVRRYPDSLEDRIGGDIIGCRYHSLLNQLACRIENLNRGSSLQAVKRKNCTATRPTPLTHTDSYGCVNWLPDSPPEGETAADQEEKQQRLMTLSEEGVSYGGNVKLLMEQTFYQPRVDIVSGYSTCDLVKSWPYLFHERGIAGHSETLLGVDVVKQMNEFVLNKGNILKKFLEDSSKEKTRVVFQEEISILQQTDINSGQCKLAALILAVMAEFGEDHDQLFIETKVGKCALVFIEIMYDLIFTVNILIVPL